MLCRSSHYLVAALNFVQPGVGHQNTPIAKSGDAAGWIAEYEQQQISKIQHKNQGDLMAPSRKISADLTSIERSRSTFVLIALWCCDEDPTGP